MSRRSIVFIAFFMFLVCVSAGAETRRWQMSVVAAEITSVSDRSAGVGVALAYAPSRAWDLELLIASRSYRSPVITIVNPGTTATEPPALQISSQSHATRAVEVTTVRRFWTERRFSPHVRGGVRYFDAPEFPLATGELPGFRDRASLQAGVGARLRLTSRTSLRADVMRLLRSGDDPADRLTRGSAGIIWHF
jgi:hypothetical protein